MKTDKKNILFYISDHGYGHAARMIAIIQELMERKEDLNIHIRASFAYDFMKNALPYSRINIHDVKNDFGVVYKEDGLSVDAKKTMNMVRVWVDCREMYLEKEKMFCREKNIDLLISDIPPFVFDVGEFLSISTIAISNFNWYRIYKELAKSKKDMLYLEKIKESYQKASYSFILPFHGGEMDIFRNKKEFSLVTRKVSLSKEQVLEKLKIDKSQKLIYVSFGFSTYNKKLIKNLENINLKKDIIILLSTGIIIRNTKNIVSIPKNCQGSHNYIGACDLAVCKVGFSTVSECIAKAIPMVLIKRKNFMEDNLTLKILKDIGIAKEIDPDEFITLSWLKDIDKYLALKNNYKDIPDYLNTKGASDIADNILEILGE